MEMIHHLFSYAFAGKELIVTNIVLASFLSAFLFSLFIILLGNAVKKGKPRNLAYLGEVVFLLLRNFVRANLGKNGDRYMPFIGTLFGYLLFSNIMGIFSPLGEMGFPWNIITSPSVDLSFTLGAAVTGFLYVQGASIMSMGLIPYLGKFFKPYALMFPINLMEEFIKPISLSVRLFGNLFGEHVVYEITFRLTHFGVPAIVMILAIFTGSIQAFVFSMLIMVYLHENIVSHQKGA